MYYGKCNHLAKFKFSAKLLHKCSWEKLKPVYFSPYQLWIKYQGRLGFLALSLYHSKRRKTNRGKSNNETTCLSFQIMHANSKTMKEDKWRVMSPYVVMGHGIKKN